MLRDLLKLRSIGIYPRDIEARNYKGGLLVDFDIAWTDPFWLFDVIDPEQLEMQKEDELERFDDMIKESGVKTPVRAAQNRLYCLKLRSRDISGSETMETSSEGSGISDLQ